VAHLTAIEQSRVGIRSLPGPRRSLLSISRFVYHLKWYSFVVWHVRGGSGTKNISDPKLYKDEIKK
jgi:hypothetical protein